MEDNEKDNEGCMGAGVTILIIIALVMMAAAFVCCKSVKVVEVPTIMHDTTTVYRYNIRHDTLQRYTRDSVYMYVKGDTVYHNSTRYIDNSRVVYRCDTVHSNKVVEKPVTVTKTEIKQVEKQLTKWQKFRLSAFWWLLGALIVTAGVVFRKPILALVRRFI